MAEIRFPAEQIVMLLHQAENPRPTKKSSGNMKFPTAQVLPGMVDIYDHIMTSGYAYSFRTGNLHPYAMMMFSGEGLICRAHGDQNFFF